MTDTQKLVAYHGRQDLKDAVLAQIHQHREADRIVRGVYEQTKRGQFSGGCAVGCTLESLRVIEGLPTIEHSDHALYERYLGIPEILARLEDGIFEGLPEEAAMDWPTRFTTAIRPGADLSMVWPRFAHNLLMAADGTVQRRCEKYPAIRPSVEAVGGLFARWIDTGTKPSADLWREASLNAAAADAAAAAAAYAAAYAATTAAGRQSERQRQADVLIRLLASAEVPDAD